MRDPLRTSGLWRASLRRGDGWSEVRGPSGPYCTGSLVEWGSITKGLVGTATRRTLDVERPVVDVLPEFPAATFTVADLVGHTSGLPRLPRGMARNPLRDPYRPTVGRALTPAEVTPVHPRGEYLYSNLGYALLGAVLNRVHGDWFAAVHEHALGPAGAGSATIDPAPSSRVVPTLFGRPIRPWQQVGSPYASAGGVWSTFDDLCRYADWALDEHADPSRTVSWQHEGVTTWINGEVRASGVVIARAEGLTAVVHTLAQAPFAADRIARAVIVRELRGSTSRGT